MDIDRKAALLRAARAFLSDEQEATAKSAGLAANTLIAAERGRSCTDKTWAALIDHYRSRGLSFVEDGDLTIIIIRNDG